MRIVAVALLAAIVVGVLSELVVFRPLRTSSPLAKLVASLGILLVLQATMLGLVFVVLATASDMAYALTASAIRGPLMRSAALPFFQRYVAGSVYVALGVLAAATGQRTRRSAA